MDRECKSLLCCRCGQAPLPIFFVPLFFSFNTVFLRGILSCVVKIFMQPCDDSSGGARLAALGTQWASQRRTPLSLLGTG